MDGKRCLEAALCLCIQEEDHRERTLSYMLSKNASYAFRPSTASENGSSLSLKPEEWRCLFGENATPPKTLRNPQRNADLHLALSAALRTSLEGDTQRRAWTTSWRRQAAAFSVLVGGDLCLEMIEGVIGHINRTDRRRVYVIERDTDTFLSANIIEDLGLLYFES